MISSSLNDTLISDDEFSKMVRVYDFSLSKLEIENNFNNNNNNNVTRSASTNSGKHYSGENKHDINSINKT